jgi:hypothetical protein
MRHFPLLLIGVHLQRKTLVAFPFLAEGKSA